MEKRTSKEYVLYALGTRGSRPVHQPEFQIFGGQTTCYLLKHNHHAIIIDCGTGLYDAEPLLKDCDIIDIIFTHVHYDHVMGLLDNSIFPKNARINLIGTFKEWLAYDTIEDFYRHPFWPIQPRIGMLCEITADGYNYPLADDINLRAYKANHPDAGNILVMDVNGKKVSFMFDFEMDREFDLGFVKDTDYLIFDGMFDDYDFSKYVGWGHSTYQQGCRVAALTHSKELLITHHDPKNNDKKLLAMEENAKTIFPKTRFVRSGDIFVIE